MAYPMTYTNHLGDSVSFAASGNYHYTGTDLRSASWKVTDLNGSVASSAREARDYKVEAVVFGGADARTAFDDVFEADILANVDGTLTAGGWSLRCRRTAADPSEWRIADDRMRVDITLHAARPVWSCDVLYHFEGATEYADDLDLDNGYPHGYPHGYGPEGLNYTMTSLANGESDFLLRMFGPCANPYVVIGANRYEVTGVQLEAGDRIEVDTRDKTAVKVTSAGAVTNVYDKLANGLRDSGTYAFQPIPRGENGITWPGSFSFDVVVHEERSAPAW